MAVLSTKIGKYKILDMAGRGNMGTVYVPHDPFEDRRVAVKVGAITDSDNSSITKRIARKLFFNEAHTAGSLNHKNIFRTYDAGEEEGEPYIVMELVESARTLNEFCSATNLMPIAQVANILFQSAYALDYAHRHGVIHRDIKPTNLLLTMDGNIKTGDFGIAQRSQAEATQIMGVLGSPRYMSPEQAREDDVNNQTDLYSLGIVAFELLTGQPPSTGQGFSRLGCSIPNFQRVEYRRIERIDPTRQRRALLRSQFLHGLDQ